MLGERPSAKGEPSVWYAAPATPKAMLSSADWVHDGGAPCF
jgi:hypothetical protein